MKREMFRKLMAASLATVMVAGLAGCGDDNKESSNASGSNSGSSVEQSSDQPSGDASGSGDDVSKYPLLKDADGNVYDLGGAEVSVYTWFGLSNPQTPYQDAVDEYHEWAQKTYNFTFTWDESGSWGSFNDFADLASGAKDTEGKLRMYMLPAGQTAVMSAMNSNLMWDLTSLGVFDWTETRFTQNGVSDLYRRGDSVYAFSPDSPEPRTGMFFNATLLEQLTGITADEMYDLQAKGEWTWDKFKEICEKIYQNGDTNGDGELDVYAIACNGRVFTNNVMYSNNTSLFKLGDDGKFVYQADDPATLEALEFQREIRQAPYWYNNPDTVTPGDTWDYFFAAFDEQGKTVFIAEDAYNISGENRFRQSDETNAGEYGFLMFPMGPNNKTGKYINAYSDNIYAIPKCYDESQAKTIAAALNIWTADVIPGYIGYNSRLDGYESGVYHERALNETLARMMSEGAFIDTGRLLPGVDVDSAFDDNSKAISEVLAERESGWKKAIEDYNNK